MTFVDRVHNYIVPIQIWARSTCITKQMGTCKNRSNNNLWRIDDCKMISIIRIDQWTNFLILIQNFSASKKIGKHVNYLIKIRLSFNLAQCASPVQPDSHLQFNYSDSQLNNGQYHGTVSFYCDSGYTIHGPNASTCHFSGTWIPQPPQCINGSIHGTDYIATQIFNCCPKNP